MYRGGWKGRLCILLSWLLVLARAPACADGDIVYSAQYYRWSGEFIKDDWITKPEETLAARGPYHLYRINPDGSGRRRITNGDGDNHSPVFSPNGRRILFVRDLPRTTLCLVSANGGKVTELYALPDAMQDTKHSWSPDGKRVAFTMAYEGRTENTLVVITIANRGVRRFPGIRDFAWSPDNRLYMGDGEKTATIWNPRTNRSRSVKNYVCNPTWLDNRTLIGDMPKAPPDYVPSEVFRIVGDDGKERRRVKTRLVGEADDYDTLFGYDGHAWYLLPGHPRTLLLVTCRFISDGEHYACYRVDRKTGICRLVRPGILLGISPDGKQCAVADHRWVGPYKRGGERVGPLKIVTLRNGRARVVTGKLVTILEGDWRKPIREGSHRRNRAAKEVR